MLPSGSQTVSVIIPTHDRVKSLARCLDHLASQSAIELIGEIIIVDDASPNEDSAALCAAHPLAEIIQYRRLPANVGPGPARNVGIDVARFPTTLFVDDDILLAPDALARLAEAGLPASPEQPSLIGRVSWDPSVNITLFMHWMTAGGPLFPYHRISDPESCSWCHYVTSLAVSSTALLRQAHFTDRLRCRYEDIELGWRVQRHFGNRLRFVEAATAGDLHGRGLVEWLAALEQIEADLVLLADLTNGEMTDAFGITRARTLELFSPRSLQLAAALIAELEPGTPVPPRCDRYYGDMWEWDALAQSYRVIQNFFRITSIRKALALPPLHASDGTTDSSTFSQQLLLELDRVAR